MSSPAPELAIQVENLSLRLRTGEPVIEDVSFEVGAGELLGVVAGGEADRLRRRHSSVIRTSPGSLWRSMTRQSLHICSRAAARPWNIA